MDPSAIDQSAIDSPVSPPINPTADMATPWLMFERFVFRRDDDDGSFPDVKAAPLRAESITSLGHRFTVALLPAKPPAVSRIYVQWPGGEGSGTELLTTCKGVLLLRLTSVVKLSAGETEKYPYHQDYFICKTIPFPPRISLKRLPECTIPIVFTAGDKEITTDRRFHADAVGLCSFGRNLLVVQLAKFFVRAEGEMGAELCVLRMWDDVSADLVASGEWEVLKVPIKHRQDEFNDIECWSVDAAITLDDRILWVDYHQGGMLIYTPREPSVSINYLRLPIDNRPRDILPSPYNLEKYRRLCVYYSREHEAFNFKFVDVAREDGAFFGPIAPGSSYTITCHTFARTKGQIWRKDAVLTSRKLQYLNSRDPFMPCDAVTTFPVLSMDDPNIVHFLVSEKRDMIDKLSVVAIDIHSEKIVSVDQYIQGDEDLEGEYADMVRHRSRLPRSFLPVSFPIRGLI